MIHKDNTVGSVVVETGRDGETTARLSDLSNAVLAQCVAADHETRGWTLT